MSGHRFPRSAVGCCQEPPCMLFSKHAQPYYMLYVFVWNFQGLCVPTFTKSSSARYMCITISVLPPNSIHRQVGRGALKQEGSLHNQCGDAHCTPDPESTPRHSSVNRSAVCFILLESATQHSMWCLMNTVHVISHVVRWYVKKHRLVNNCTNS